MINDVILITNSEKINHLHPEHAGGSSQKPNTYVMSHVPNISCWKLSKPTMFLLLVSQKHTWWHLCLPFLNPETGAVKKNMDFSNIWIWSSLKYCYKSQKALSVNL